jgi:hypothetical protein
MEGSALRHVEHLQAPADGEKREILVEGGLAQRHFPRVPLTGGTSGLFVWQGAIPGWIDIGPAGDHQAVQYGHRPARLNRRRG